MICNYVQTYVGECVCVCDRHLVPNKLYEYEAQIWGGGGGGPCSVSLSAKGSLGWKRLKTPALDIGMHDILASLAGIQPCCGAQMGRVLCAQLALGQCVAFQTTCNARCARAPVYIPTGEKRFHQPCPSRLREWHRLLCVTFRVLWELGHNYKWFYEVQASICDMQYKQRERCGILRKMGVAIRYVFCDPDFV